MTERTLDQSATEIAQQIRRGELTSRACLDTHIAQIARVNPKLNAVVCERFELARAEADFIDRMLATKGPGYRLESALLGVPCTIKEAFAVQGMPNCSGLVSRRTHVSQSDATAVARLREAGVVIMGVTNTSELCMWLESDNRVYGRTNNAFDLTRTCGGSSGGEGAIVGAGASPFGLGSDIGGSIRIPAFFNGVYGHKPSGGRVPGTGQFPMAHGSARRMLSTGPLARRAQDLALLLEILEGPDGTDDACVEMPKRKPSDIQQADLQVFVVDEACPVRASDSLRGAQRLAADSLASMGAQVQSLALPELRHALEMWSAAMHAAGGESFASLLGQGTPVSALGELVKLARGRSEHTFPALGLALLEKIPELFPKQIAKSLAALEALRVKLTQLLGDRGVLLMPPYARTAPPHQRALLRPIEYGFTAVINALEFPATSVPMGLDSEGLPLGVQVIGGWQMDHLTIACAQWLEADGQRWTAPAWTRS
ncbi:MAG: amidase [Deltaproteobacteria bacterium]|nr:amidase [Deltaproteobacteria bacterium]